MIIDTHLHLWSLDRPECNWPTTADSLIYCDHGIDDVRPILVSNGVGAVVLVQSQEHADDTSWLFSIAGEEPLVAGVVGWCDLLSEQAPVRIAELAARPKAVGVRPMVQQREADWYDQPALDRAFEAIVKAGLVLEALIRVRHLPALHRLATRHPGLSIVIDHAAKPAVGGDNGELDAWRATIAPLADCAGVTCKLSGLLTECVDGARREEVARYITVMLALFGADRLMWGSDWPVVNLAADYGKWLELARSTIPSKNHDQVFSLTASATYGLAVAGAQ